MRIAIIGLTGSDETVPCQWAESAFDFASALQRERAAVSVSFWSRPELDELWPQVSSEADRVLLWDRDITLDLAATRMALRDQPLLAALDSADLVTAACPAGPSTLAVFTGGEVFARPRDNIGAELAGRLRERREPCVIAGCGVLWLWIHTGALARLGPVPARPYVVAGIDITLSRRLITGGASAACHPAIAVCATMRFSHAWALAPEETSATPCAASAEPPSGSAEGT